MRRDLQFEKAEPFSKRIQLDYAAKATPCPGLLRPRAPALDQNNKNNDKKHTGNNLDDRRTTHSSSLSCSEMIDSLPGLSETLSTPGANAARSPVRETLIAKQAHST
jgi:hypothetical protein